MTNSGQEGHAFPTMTLFIEDLYNDETQEDPDQHLFHNTLDNVLDFLHLEPKAAGIPIPSKKNKKGIEDFLTPSELEESIQFIQKYASPEVWNVLHQRYLSKYMTTT